MDGYTDTFYAVLDTTALPSARRIVPLLLELIEVKSAVDVGCGNAAWLAVLKEHGVTDVLGIDGAHASRRHLRIPEEQFTAASLEEPLTIDRRFDLAISLEVAEHLSPKRAEGFVADLTRLAPIVLFSAAIPGQGGVHHVNEQWPDYWAALFDARGYAPIDAIRWRVLGDPAVAWWYAQNILLFASAQALRDNPRLAELRALTPETPWALVHPTLYLRRARPGLGRWLKAAPGAARRSLARLLGWKD